MAKKLTEEEKRLRYKGLSFERRYLVRDDFSFYDFTGSYLEDIMFMSANVEGVNFTDATLKDVDFSHANLCNANFTRATFQGTLNLSHAKLDGAIFTDVSFEGAELIGGNIARVSNGEALQAEFVEGAVTTPAATSAREIIYLPDGITIDGAKTTAWADIPDDATIVFRSTSYEYDKRFADFYSEIVRIMLPQRNNFEIIFFGDKGFNEVRFAFSKDSEERFRVEFLGAQNLEPGFSSKRRIAFKEIGWNGSDLEQDLLGFYRDFEKMTPSRVIEQFIIHSIKTLSFLGYHLGLGQVTNVLKNEKVLLAELNARFRSQFEILDDSPGLR